MDYMQKALDLHRESRGKIAVATKVSLNDKEDLATAYTPGVAAPCQAIEKEPAEAYTYTAKGNLVAVVTDGSAVLGLGNIGPMAAMPVMEGKCAIFKTFGGVDAVPICLDTQEVDDIVRTVANIAPTFGGINLEDIAAPRCFEIEEKLQAKLDIPVFHDDQHGTAVVVSAGLINALRVVGKSIADVKVVVCGIGAAGTAIIKMLMAVGVEPTRVVPVDKNGIMTAHEPGLDPTRRELVERINPGHATGSMADALMDADVFIGVSAPGVLTPEMVGRMAGDAIIFANANPTPEIMPDLALAAGARVVGTGRSDFPNQINNSLVFPGLFRGALDARASRITEAMKVAAAYAVADLIPAEELRADYVIPSMFHADLADTVAKAVEKAWMDGIR